MRLQAKYNANAHRYMDEQIALQEKLDNLSEQVSDKMEELRGIEARIKRFNDQYAEEKEVRQATRAFLCVLTEHALRPGHGVGKRRKCQRSRSIGGRDQESENRGY